MPRLSQYWFPDRLYVGTFEGFNLKYQAGNWAWISNRASSGATLLWNRTDNELVLPLSPFLNSGPALTIVDRFFTKATRSSDIMTQGLFWFEAPYHDDDPSRHSDNDLLVRLYFNFHIETPGYCYNRDGTIGYYIVPFLDAAGHVHAFIDEWEWSVSDRPDVCQGNIEDQLNKDVPGAMPTLQLMLDQFLGGFSKFTFSTIFLLPGSGTPAEGDFSENADTDVALVLVES